MLFGTPEVLARFICLGKFSVFQTKEMSGERVMSIFLKFLFLSWQDWFPPARRPGKMQHSTLLYFFVSGRGNTDDQRRNPNINNKDQLVG